MCTGMDGRSTWRIVCLEELTKNKRIIQCRSVDLGSLFRFFSCARAIELLAVRGGKMALLMEIVCIVLKDNEYRRNGRQLVPPRLSENKNGQLLLCLSS